MQNGDFTVGLSYFKARTVAARHTFCQICAKNLQKWDMTGALHLRFLKIQWKITLEKEIDGARRTRNNFLGCSIMVRNKKNIKNTLGCVKAGFLDPNFSATFFAIISLILLRFRPTFFLFCWY